MKAKIENLGPITLSELDLELKAQNAPAIRETWSGDLPVGTWTEHTFKGRIEKGDGIPRICVTGTDPNGLEDHIPWNNEACWTPKGGLRILNIYPNPSSKFLYVEMRPPSDQDLSYRIYDPRGRIVLDRRIEDAQKGFLRIRPPLGKLEDGTYTIRIEGANDQVQEQFIKGER